MTMGSTATMGWPSPHPWGASHEETSLASSTERGSDLPPGPHSSLYADAAVILPTFNERENIQRALQELDTHLVGLPYRVEIVVVDDNSPDGTAEVARATYTQVRTRVLVRRKERGLASAILWGIRLSHARAALIMDADGSHPADMVQNLLRLVMEGRAQMAIASRYIHEGEARGWPWRRRLMSRFGTWFARPLTRIRDPMSGFFAVDTSLLERSPLDPIGYKMGLEILVRCAPTRVVEVPFVFTDRRAGASKMNHREVLAYIRHLARLYRWKYFRWSLGGRSPPSGRSHPQMG